MTDPTPEPEFIARIDGEQFVDAVSKLAAAMVELSATVAVFDARISALEAKGRKPRKGFTP